MKKAIISLVVSLCTLAVTLGIVLSSGDSWKNESRQNASEQVVLDTDTQIEEEPLEINLIMVGDMLIHKRVYEACHQADGSYNFDSVYKIVKERVTAADLALVNQETVLAGNQLGIIGYPRFNSPQELADAEAKAGFDVILQATNHALDKGADGLRADMDYYKTHCPELSVIGVNESEEAQNTIFITEVKGVKIAILNYTYGTNGLVAPAGQKYLVNYLDEDRVRADLEKARQLADFVVVCPHWGTEYQLTPSKYQKHFCEVFLEYGVDLVIGTHPHVIQPIEMYEREDGHEMLVYYSLGNFINGTASLLSDAWKRYVGGMADVTIALDENGKPYIKEYGVIPLVTQVARGSDYTVYFLEDYTEELASTNLAKRTSALFTLENCKGLVKEVWDLDL